MSKRMFRRYEEVQDIEFFINGTKHVVSEKFPPSTTLSDYIRDIAGLTGTKLMCKEGGCGCCAVTVTHASNAMDRAETMSINSCLCPLYSVDGWQITTIEGIGNRKEGFHPIQKRLADYNGTQCGYCSPGFVMSMYGLMHQRRHATQQEIENSFDGHICRCTGYRSILDAMKSFGTDSNAEDWCFDIEDLNKKLCPKTGQSCYDKSDENRDKGTLPRPLAIQLKGSKWYRPICLKELSKIASQHKANSIKMVYGNTARGIYKKDSSYDVYIDLRAVVELQDYEEREESVMFGAGTTLTQLEDFLVGLENTPGFHYCQRMIQHVRLIGNVLVRNAGCIAGNLMIKHAHKDFPSDLFTIMEAIGAKIDVLDMKSLKRVARVSLLDFLRLDMSNKIVLCLDMPKWRSFDQYRSFKITPRSQNAYAYVNAAFRIPIRGRNIIARPSIVLGGISGETVHAVKTEAYLNGKVLDNSVFQEAVTILHNELDPSNNPLLASPKYRRELAINLLYKTLLEVYRTRRSNIQSGAVSLERPLSSGMFTFQEKPDEFPLKKPLPQKTAILQASGTAKFINDMPSFQHELAGAFVTSSIASGSIKKIDPTDALKIPGVIKFIGTKDLIGAYENNYIAQNALFPGLEEELFATREVYYEGQGIGVVLAETMALAQEGARKVKITYEFVTQPILTVDDAIENNSKHDAAYTEEIKGNVEEALKGCTYVVEGEVRTGSQYQFFLENHVALTVPSEDGIDIYTSHQWADFAQSCVAKVINRPRNYCNVVVPRVGGAFGGKTLHASACAAAAAVCTEITDRPVRLTMDLATSMKMTEKRCSIVATYRAGCDAYGKMQAVNLDVFIDTGFRHPIATLNLMGCADQGYFIPNWRMSNTYLKTNKCMAGSCHGPEAVPGVLISETIMEHMAKEFGENPILFKEPNLYQAGQSDFAGHQITHCSLSDMWKQLKQTAEITARMVEVEKLNKDNLWRKRGITMTAIKYDMNYSSGAFPTSVSIFAGDGTVTVNTGGVEMGQGLHMKVAQAVASCLGVSIDQVKVRPVNSNFMANGLGTGNSTSSERCVRSAIKACEKIKEALQPMKEKMNGAPLPEILKAATSSGIPLTASVQDDSGEDTFQYCTFMVAVTETEVDVLTGEFQLNRVDIMADAGDSLNPAIDLGQVEGAYVMGLGAYLTEDISFDLNSGKLLNDGTWEYKPPTTKDIPIDWRIHFLPDNRNSSGVLGSKATEEPAVGLAAGSVMAIRAAVEEARRELTNQDTFLNICTPFTVEKIQQAANVGLFNLRVTDASRMNDGLDN